ncbi:DNA polymerase I [Cytophaga hutchinsonii]|uniref:DNA polymerase I n=1 Tax=Cytophaga hutchinsonii (strain ATCC 33406 / DSM 1761 / CIP 103989 / NBRC 15051 / NCIMB 9469 / D465) TaxID=269798 RepID=A0A6N4SWF6_CYTH3|nr:DNA polymerase I [Cytophaga hutchinsonii]ABG60890.1 DNA polymerase I [Cytophaga hutchinsonii ATCC 33406]SFX41953.1 DNA polymerase I [Cytophaga hutchinsonii ATCC 33406]
MKKLFLLDAMALIYRAHFAFSKNPRVTSTGISTGAVFGFTNSLLEILLKEKPTHIGVAFDLQGPTFRHDNFTEYKANRQEQPEDISVAIPYIYRLLEGMNIPILGVPGYEADDIVGTFSKIAPPLGFDVYMMTMDKDYMQLVNEHVFLYRPAYMGNDVEIYDINKVLAKFNIKEVDQVRDILGLQGDTVDNIPGIPGIGEKTAQKLIADFGSVENLIKNADQLKGKQKENVINFAAQGLLSKELATIHCEVPIEFDEEALRVKEYNIEALDQLFDELEFRTLKKRLFGNSSSASETEKKMETKATKKSAAVSSTGQMGLFGMEAAETITEEFDEKGESKETIVRDTIDTVLHDYYVVDTEAEIVRLTNLLLLQESFCFDTETTSLNALEAELVGLAISFRAKEAYYIPFTSDQIQTQRILDLLQPAFEKSSITKVGQNLKYDLLVLKKYNFAIAGPLFDTMLAHYLLEPEMRHGMDTLAEVYLNYTPVSIEQLIGKKGAKQGTMRDVEIEAIKEYAAEDADITFQLYKFFSPLVKDQNLNPLFNEVEMPLSEVLADMELEGVKIDTQALSEFSSLLQTEITAVEKEIYEHAGVQFNISSPKQLGEILFDKLKLDPNAKKTKTGQYATGEDVLTKLDSDHPILANILDYREFQKLKSTYVDALPLLLGKDGRVHTSFNQAVAATGRLSSTNPNLQNIPIRTDRGKEIRRAFVARDNDHVILSADYSQIELRIMAAFSKDESMLNAFRKGVDIHSTTASKVFKVPIEDVTADMRRKAKMVNFGIIYGISAFGLSQRLSIPRKEAAEIITAYFTEFPAVKAYMDACVNSAREVEYVETILGRRRFLRDINSRNMTMRGFAERNAINAPIQGSAADMIKVAMIRIHDWMKKENLKSKMVLQVHDELLFDAHKDEIDLLKTQVEIFMKEAIALDVPMEVGMGIGENWLEAH